MKLFGLNINVTRSAPTPSPVTRNLSPEAAAWLAGHDYDDHSGPVLSNAYQQSVWVYRAINVLAEQVANLPFLFSTGERGREHLITSGPLLDFYAHPHPHLNRFQYWELRIFWLMLRGECFRIPIYDDAIAGSPSPRGEGRGEGEFSGSFPSRITQHASTSGPRPSTLGPRHLARVLILDPACFQHVVEDGQIIGWRYTGSGPQAPLDSQVFLPEEVWFERLPNPFDFWRGMPPLYVAALAAKTDFAAANFMRGFMENNADSGLIVRTSEQLDDTQREQLKAAINNRKRNGAADRPLLLWSAAEVVQPTLSSADVQFLENRKFSRAEICAAFGVPEEIVATSDHNKYDVMQGARLNFIENRVAPLCARLEAEEDLTVKSLDPSAVGWFDLESLPIMQQARRARLATAKTGFDMGVPFNELNRILDLGFPELPSGNTGYLPATLQPVPSASASASSSSSSSPNGAPAAGSPRPTGRAEAPSGGGSGGRGGQG